MACRLLHTVFVRHGREEPLPPEAVKGAQDERRKDTPTLCQKLEEKAILNGAPGLQSDLKRGIQQNLPGK